MLSMILIGQDKKVLLRERKRHTARRVASACYAVLVGGGGGTYTRQGGTYLGRGVPTQNSVPTRPDLGR